MGKIYIFECENGKKYTVGKGMCLSCKNCSDVFYDEYGPYICFCGKNYSPEATLCPVWEEDETMLTMEEGE